MAIMALFQLPESTTDERRTAAGRAAGQANGHNPAARLRSGLARAAIAAGASVYTCSPVIALAQKGTHWRLSTPNGRTLAHWVIVATDAYTRGPWPTLRREFTYLPYFNVATRPLDQPLRDSILPERQGMTDTSTVMSSVRIDQTGRLIVGSIGALRGTGNSVHVAWAKRTIRKLFPQVTNVDLEYAWYGSIGMTDSHLPKFHRLAPRVLSIAATTAEASQPARCLGVCWRN
jgi:glycine/D-amino acid oxidase-like deaminating enzyme